jgi:catechol 2,3-dioxygenase-like lactoylglutathione lyase family enzyme
MAIGGRLTHLGLCVSDMERSRRFWCEVMGFAPSAEFPELRVENEMADRLLSLRAVSLHAVYLERDGFRIELLHYASPRSPAVAPARGMNDLGLTHLSVRVPDVKAAMAAIEAGGGRVERATAVEIEGLVVAVFARDPDGLPIELVLGPS